MGKANFIKRRQKTITKINGFERMLDTFYSEDVHQDSNSSTSIPLYFV